jgi:hypothetical protein
MHVGSETCIQAFEYLWPEWDKANRNLLLHPQRRTLTCVIYIDADYLHNAGFRCKAKTETFHLKSLNVPQRSIMPWEYCTVSKYLLLHLEVFSSAIMASWGGEARPRVKKL